MVGAEPVISPALVNLAGALIWTGEFDEGDYWLHTGHRALETDIGPLVRLLLHIGTGILLSGRRRQREALADTAPPSTCRPNWKAPTRWRRS